MAAPTGPSGRRLASAFLLGSLCTLAMYAIFRTTTIQECLPRGEASLSVKPNAQQEQVPSSGAESSTGLQKPQLAVQSKPVPKAASSNQKRPVPGQVQTLSVTGGSRSEVKQKMTELIKKEKGEKGEKDESKPASQGHSPCEKQIYSEMSRWCDGAKTFVEYFEELDRSMKGKLNFKDGKIHRQIRQLRQLWIYKCHIRLDLFLERYHHSKFFFVGPRNSMFWTLKELLCQKDYGHIMNYTFGKKDIVFDIGANTGLFGVLLAKLNPSVRVHSFEASPVTSMYAAENIRLNGVGDRVHLHNVAITDHGNPIVMFNCVFRDRKTTMSGHAHCGPWGQWGEGFNLKVQTKRWSTILADTGTTKIKLLKMDCEGCECDVLSDMKNMTTPVQISTAVGECHSLAKSHVAADQRSVCRRECDELLDKSVLSLKPDKGGEKPDE